MRSPTPFHFMHWAKTWVGRVPYCMGASGVTTPRPGEIDLGAPPPPASNYYGEEALRRAIAAVHGVDVDHVLVSEGASLANYNALTVLAGPGDRILVESPTYPVLAEIPRFHRAEVTRLVRRPEDGWQPRLEDVRAELDRPGAPVAAVVLTRLHNPSGADLNAAFLEELAALAEARDFYVMLGEVYLDFIDGATPGHRLSPRFVTTGSLTKAYGFGPLRVGWVIGAPAVLQPMREFSFYLAVDGAHESQAMGTRILERRDAVLSRSRRIADRGSAIVDEWVRGRGDVSWTRPAGGITGIVRFERLRETREFAERLRTTEGVNFPEGEYFGLPGWGRLSYGGDEEMLREGLRRLGRALDAEAGGLRIA